MNLKERLLIYWNDPKSFYMMFQVWVYNILLKLRIKKL